MFIDHFNALDLQARQVSSIEAYKKRYVMKPLTRDEQRLVDQTWDLTKLDVLMRRWGLVVPFYPSVRCVTHNDPLIEGNMPHTFDNTIVLPRNEFKSESFRVTLHHEYMHILQRWFPTVFDAFYEKHWQLRPVLLPTEPWLARRRTNPDALSLYQFHNGTYVTQLYHVGPLHSLHQSRPVYIVGSTITDIVDHGQPEHPHERLAVAITFFFR